MKNIAHVLNNNKMIVANNVVLQLVCHYYLVLVM